MAKAIMIQGTMSSAGKSLVNAGLCRIFKQDGYRVAPFKSQNMALNSYITKEGLEMGRAQVVQAESAGIEPSVLMNPILLKPTSDTGSQVIVNGEVYASMDAQNYYDIKPKLRGIVEEAYDKLAKSYDIIVIEGAGSPAEINLKHDDIVNMGMAKIADAPVLLVGDIDRGGVFASLYGTLALLEEDERTRVKGTIINKFRGDIALLKDGLSMLEELTNVPVLGVVPYLNIDIDDEDSVTERFSGSSKGLVDIAVIRLPHISNFTDFNTLSRLPKVGLRYVSSAKELGCPDAVILPGTKNTMGDLAAIRQSGLEAAVKKLASSGVPVIGICGGYQMLGMTLRDPDSVEGGGSMAGMELLDVDTEFAPVKTRTQTHGKVSNLDGIFKPLSGTQFSGYEIHMGKTTLHKGASAFATLDSAAPDGSVKGSVLGCYVHGLFDDDLGEALVRMLTGSSHEENSVSSISAYDYKQLQYDKLADALRTSLNMQSVYEIIENGV